MTYLGICGDYRYTVMVSTLMSTCGVILLVISLQTVDFLLVTLALSFVTPLVASIVFHQRLLAKWALNSSEVSESIDWVVELFALVIVLASLILLELHESPDGSYSVLLPIVGSFCLGSSLGLFKKVALAQKSVGPRFVTAFIFYATFCLVLLTPLFKYPGLSADI